MTLAKWTKLSQISAKHEHAVTHSSGHSERVQNQATSKVTTSEKCHFHKRRKKIERGSCPSQTAVKGKKEEGDLRIQQTGKKKKTGKSCFLLPLSTTVIIHLQNIFHKTDRKECSWNSNAAHEMPRNRGKLKLPIKLLYGKKHENGNINIPAA